MNLDLQYRKNTLFLYTESGITQLESKKPYFYVIAEKNNQLHNKLLKSVEHTDIEVEETGFLPIVFNGKQYDISEKHTVYRISAISPIDIPILAHKFADSGFSVAGFNIKYVVRMAWDYDIQFFDTAPLYYTLDSSIIDKLSKLKILLLDLEVKSGQPYLISLYLYSPFGEIKKSDIQHYFLPREKEQVVAELSKANILAGHNIISFDIPLLRKAGYIFDIDNKIIVDTSQILASWSSSLQIGSARSLLDVAKTMQKALGIPQEEIEIKERYKGKVENITDSEFVNYNINDIALTARILSPIFTFIAILSAMTQIPLSTITQLTAGTVAEYYFFRSLESRGLIPEYRKIEWDASMEKVYIKAEQYLAKNVGKFDIKMMYPTFVTKNFVDPTLMIQDPNSKYGVRFDYNSGLGLLWSELMRLIRLRQITRSLKKKDSRFEQVDNGVKAILNSLAYGVQGKKSGYGPLANPYTPRIIFIETSDILFKTIRALEEKGLSVVYGDTDSIFIENVSDIQTVHKIVQEEFGKHGFEVDIEGFYELGYFLKKKNYVLLGEDYLVKGGTFKMKSKFYLPQIISKNLLRLFAMNREERRKYIRELIESAAIEELFSSVAQQLWRTVGKDLVSAKQALREEKEVVYVRTPWEELPRIVLKKIQLYHLLMPTNAPLVAFLINNMIDSNFVQLSNFSPYLIVESSILYIPQELSNVVSGLGVDSRLLVLLNGQIFEFKPRYLKYILSSKINPMIEISADSINSTFNYYKLVGLKSEFELKHIRIERDVLNRLVYTITVRHLNSLGLL